MTLRGTLIDTHMDIKILRSGKYRDKMKTSNKRPAEYGLCSTCQNMGYRTSRLGEETCWCDSQDVTIKHARVTLTKNDPIEVCSMYKEHGRLSLDAMIEMATLLVFKDPIGFKGNGEMEIIKPGDERHKKMKFEVFKYSE